VFAPEIIVWGGGYSPGDLGDASPPMGSGGETPVGVWERITPEGEKVSRHCLQILAAETIKF